MPRFSVVIPVYNRPDLAVAAVESVLAQRFTDYELIVVDDGSTLSPAEALGRFGDRVRLLRQDNAGQGVARNFGVAHSAGEYIAFLDSDDLWLPWTLEIFDRALREEGDPSLLLGSRRYFSEDHEAAGFDEQPLSYDRFDDFLALQRQGPTPAGAGTMVVLRAAYEQVEGFASVRCNSEDVDLFLRLGEAPGCVRLDHPITLACRRHDSNSSKDTDRSVEGLRYLLERERQGAYPGANARRVERLAVLTFQARSLSMRLASEGRLGEALGFYASLLGAQVREGRIRYALFGPAAMAWRWLQSRPADRPPEASTRFPSDVA